MSFCDSCGLYLGASSETCSRCSTNDAQLISGGKGMIRTENKGSNICTKCGLYNGPEFLNNTRGGGSGWDKVRQGLNRNRCLCDKDGHESLNSLDKMNKITTNQREYSGDHTISGLFKERNKILFSILVMNLVLGMFVYLFKPFIDPNIFQYSFLPWGFVDIGENYGIYYIPNPIYLGQISLIWFYYNNKIKKIANLPSFWTRVKYCFASLLLVYSISTITIGPYGFGMVFNCMFIFGIILAVAIVFGPENGGGGGGGGLKLKYKFTLGKGVEHYWEIK